MGRRHAVVNGRRLRRSSLKGRPARGQTRSTQMECRGSAAAASGPFVLHPAAVSPPAAGPSGVYIPHRTAAGWETAGTGQSRYRRGEGKRKRKVRDVSWEKERNAYRTKAAKKERKTTAQWRIDFRELLIPWLHQSSPVHRTPATRSRDRNNDQAPASPNNTAAHVTSTRPQSGRVSAHSVTATAYGVTTAETDRRLRTAGGQSGGARADRRRSAHRAAEESVRTMRRRTARRTAAVRH